MSTEPTEALRLVPVEPTEAMQNAGVDAATNLFDGWVDEGQVSTLYRAMLAAAPASPLPGGGWQEKIKQIEAERDEALELLAAAMKRNAPDYGEEGSF